MGQLLANALKSARERLGKTQDEVAEAVGVSRQAVTQWEAGDTEPATKNLIKVCDYLGISVTAATGGMVKLKLVHDARTDPKTPRMPDAPVIVDRRPEFREAEEEIARISPRSWPNDVPVLGVAVGGGDADFSMNGEVIDYAKRPPTLANMKRVYAVYVVGSSMAPRFEEGELVYVNPARPPLIGDYVIIEMRATLDSGELHRGFLKRLRKRTPTKVVVEQFNPPAELEFANDEIKSLHRIIPWTELFG